MALSHSNPLVSLNSSTATALWTVPTVTTSIETRRQPQYQNVSIQNTDASIVIYIGGPGVTATAYGVALSAGQSITLDSLGPNEIVYAISASGTPKAALLFVTSA